jgi:hypothetical protein
MRQMVAMSSVLLAFHAADAGAVTHLPPCQSSSCTNPVVDGVVGDIEYANGVGYPLSNFDAGGPNGAARLYLEDDRLYIGLRLPAPASDRGRRGDLQIYLDADRPDTSCAPVAEPLGGEDRILLVSYDLDADTWSLAQKVGGANGWQVPGPPSPWLKLWQSTVSVSEPADDPGMVHVEIAIRLRPQGASSSTVISDGSLGLAFRHTATGSLEHMPGSAAVPPKPDLPCTWETLDFTQVVGVPLSMATWSLGVTMTTPGVVPDEIWDREIVCLSRMDEYPLQEIIDEVNAIRAHNQLDPMVPTTNSTIGGLAVVRLLLTSRPVIASAQLATDDGHVFMLWARVLTEASVPGDERKPFKAGEFVDIYCGSPNNADQAVKAKNFIEGTRATDRPAFLLAFTYHELHLFEAFGLDQLTPFEQANTWLSDLHDFGSVATPADPGLLKTHMFALPPTDPWPAFGIAQEPIASTEVPTDAHGHAVGEGPILSASLELVRTDQPGHWNPKKEHAVTYSVSRLIDHASGGCCADWFTTGIGFLGSFLVPFSDDQTPDGDDVNPGWKGSHVLAAGQVTATAQVWDWDAGPNDHYDVIPESLSWDPFFRITHTSGLVERVDLFGNLVDVLGTFEQNPGGMAVQTKGNEGEIGTAFHVITAEEID